MNDTKTKHFFLERQNEFVECELVTETKFRREIRFVEGPKTGQVRKIHPVGAAWGRMYPRLFQSDTKPVDHFSYRGRILMKMEKTENSTVPTVEPDYSFQPYTTAVIDAINSKENVLLTGSTGCGKTSCIEQLAAQTDHQFLRVNLNSETRMSDFLGKLLFLDGQTVWVDGILPLAMKNGWWLLLDEIDFADPAILSILHPVLEENSMLVLKENRGEVIRPHENFRLFATSNTIGAMQDRASEYAGTTQMNEAFLDRFQIVLVPNLPPKDEMKVLKSKAPSLKHRWAKRMVQFAGDVRSHQTEGFQFSSDTFSTRRLISWARKTALLGSPIEGAKRAWLDKVPASEQAAVMRLLEVHFGKAASRKPAGRKKRARKAATSGANATGDAAKQPVGRPTTVPAPVVP
jgi:MoxR-like ATPase